MERMTFKKVSIIKLILWHFPSPSSRVFQWESLSAANLNKSQPFKTFISLLQTDRHRQHADPGMEVCSRLPIISGYCFYSTKSLFGGPKYSYVGSTAACKKKMSDTLERCSNSNSENSSKVDGRARSRGYHTVSEYRNVKGRECWGL